MSECVGKDYNSAVTGGALVLDLKPGWNDQYSINELDAPCFIAGGSMKNSCGVTWTYVPIPDRIYF